MNKDEVVNELLKYDLMFDSFLHYMSGKAMEINSNHDILFPKKDVYNFIDKNTYNKKHNYD
jgi:hypothetical protein